MIKHWTFEDPDIAANFDTYVRGQLPWYSLATELVVCIAENYLPLGGRLYDIGASTGNITISCSDLIESRKIQADSIESSKEMCKVWAGKGDIHHADAITFEFEPFDLCVCFLTLMFIAPSERKELIHKLKKRCKKGGAIVIVDKFNIESGYNATVMRRMTMRQKLTSGVNADEIINKELSLSGIQRPLDVDSINGDQFFQAGEFQGFLLKLTNDKNP